MWATTRAPKFGVVRFICGDVYHHSHQVDHKPPMITRWCCNKKQDLKDTFLPRSQMSSSLQEWRTPVRLAFLGFCFGDLSIFRTGAQPNFCSAGCVRLHAATKPMLARCWSLGVAEPSLRKLFVGMCTCAFLAHGWPWEECSRTTTQLSPARGFSYSERDWVETEPPNLRRYFLPCWRF